MGTQTLAPLAQVGPTARSSMRRRGAGRHGALQTGTVRIIICFPAKGGGTRTHTCCLNERFYYNTVHFDNGTKAPSSVTKSDVFVSFGI